MNQIDAAGKRDKKDSKPGKDWIASNGFEMEERNQQGFKKDPQ